MTISIKTHKMLWGRAANRCSFPTCRKELVMDATETDDESLVGEACHIVAREVTGPRGESELTPEQRDKYGNLILMCCVHHKQIDDQVNSYSVENLQRIKDEHEEWVRTSLAGFDQERQRDDEIYAGYIDYWQNMGHLEEWEAWSSHVLGSDPHILGHIDEDLTTLRKWILCRIWPHRYQELEEAINLFRRVLQDFQLLFHKHSIEKGDVYVIERFYKTRGERGYNPNYYDDLKEYENYVDLVADLMLELTRSANLVCDMFRKYVDRAYRIQEGVLLVMSGPDMSLQFKNYRTEYRNDDIANFPYAGIEAFLETRRHRDICFGC